MHDEIKMLDEIFKFLQATPIIGEQSERMTQAKQYVIGRIQQIQQPPQTEE